MTNTDDSEAASSPEAEPFWAKAWRGSYQAARQEWLERYGDHIAAAKSWRRVAMLALITAALALAALIWTGTQKEVVPYVVEVDKLGAVAALDRADRLDRPQKHLITAALARWIAGVRTVYADAAAQRSLVGEAYAMVNRFGEAHSVLNEHMRAHDPFERARTETVAVDVRSVLPIAGDSWRIEWREEIRSRDGTRIASTDYQASVSLSFSPPRDEAAIRANPLGLYVSAFHWAQRL